MIHSAGTCSVQIITILHRSG